jgi:hypothetical protein
LIQEEIKRRLNSGNACCYSAFSAAAENVKIRKFKIIIFLLVLCGCETWSMTLREEHRQRVFENRVQSRIFGPKRTEVTGGWRKLHNEEHRDLYS